MTVIASNYDRQANDLYETPEWVTRALLRHFPVTGSIVWEPAAGNHKMVDLLRHVAAGVFASDIFTYSRPQDRIFDFLDERAEPAHHFTDIVTNPPYGLGNRQAAKFARLALARCAGMVALLCTAKFDFGKTRADLFRDNRRYAAKIALTDRVNWFDGGEHENSECHAWYVWAPTRYANGAPARLLYAGRDAA